MKRILSYLLSTLLVLPLLSACVPSNGFPVLESKNMTFDLADRSTITPVQFNLGEGDLTNALGNPVPNPLNGLIALPEGEGPHPLVVLIHGVRMIEDVYTDETYRGFDYLVEQLAAEGFAAMSINISVTFTDRYGESEGYQWAISTYEQHMAMLEQAIAGKDVGYGMDLTNKIDLNQIHLVGHSRGAQVAEELARNEAGQGRNQIQSFIALAPSEAVYFEGPPPNIPIGIVVAENDRDVRTGDGQAIFDHAKDDPARTAPLSLVFLRNANHAYFNRYFEPDVEAMSREQQEDFTMHYVSAFLSVFAKDQAPFATFQVDVAQPSTMFRHAVTASYLAPEGQRLIFPEEERPRPRMDGNVEVNYVNQGWDEVLFFHPATWDLSLYDIRWQSRGAEVSFELDSDFSGFRALSLYVAVNPSVPLNPRNRFQSFSIVVGDAAGKVAGVTIPDGIGALSFYQGSIWSFQGDEFSPPFQTWEGLTPLGELRIPISLFEGIDLANVTEIRILFDQRPRGAIMMSDVMLQK